MGKNPANMFYDEPPQTTTQVKGEEVPKPDLSPKVYEPVEEVPDAVEMSVEHEVGNIIDLPSKGLLGYPGSISYREVMAGDEEILKTSTNKNFSRTVNRVLKDICNNPEFFDDLYIGDRDYILTHIWANTYSSDKEFEVRCRHCGTKEEVKMDIFELPSIEVKENFKPRFPLKIAKTGDTINLRLVTVRDDNNAEKFLADNPKLEYSFEIVHFALAIEFGRPMAIRDRVEYLKKNVNAKEMAVIKEFHRYFRFGLDTSFEHTCGECSGVTRGDIPFLPEDIIAPQVRTDFEELLRTQ